ncbi:MAG: anion permease [Dehalococcoidia bacterium]|nr:anion permease [Dehalococcoidia bacterium]
MTSEIVLVLAVIMVVSILLTTEKLRVDIVALLVMVGVAWLGLVTPAQAFSGLSSNAVVAVMAVMILSRGLDHSGVTRYLTGPILKLAGANESRLIALVSATVGTLSGFMQNVGAAALFLPALLKLSRTQRLPLSRLLMPMGFAAILGGTLTMVGSGPLIILNDLLKQRGETPFGLLAVTPIGIALLAGGILYFRVLGKRVLPPSAELPETTPQKELIDAWGLPTSMAFLGIPNGSPLVGRTPESALLWKDYNLHLLALEKEGDILYAPWRHTSFSPGQQLALLGADDDASRFASDFGLENLGKKTTLSQLLQGGEEAGFAELIVRPRATVRGQTLRQIALRRNYAVEPLVTMSGSREERGDFSDTPIAIGDTMVIHGTWANIQALENDRDFVLLTPLEGGVHPRRSPLLALLCFAAGIALALLGVQLSLGLLSGAIAMVLLRVLTIDEAYRAVDWRTVFLLAGLIPLGIAMEETGAAAYIAGNAVDLVHGSHPLLLFLVVGVLSTLFSLFMSNVAATVLLVPLVISMATMAGTDPRPLALLVAVCASNSFVLPTHQVNALLMGPGGYRNRDYIRAGGLMSIVFLAISVPLIYLCYA